MSVRFPTLGGGGARVTQGIGRQSFTARGSGGKWRHPWFTALRHEQGQWTATVKPGFVNGQCPIVRTTALEQGADAKDFGTNPLTGKKYFSDPVFNGGQTVEPKLVRVDVPLYLSPRLTMSWRPLGWDGPPGSQVPEFFANLGAGSQPRIDLSAPEVNLDLLPQPPEGLRLLRVCDVVLHQPRLALTSTLNVLPGLLTGGFAAQQTLSLLAPPAGDSLRLFSGVFQPPVEIDPTAFDFTEQPFDERLVARCYLLSPPKTPQLSEPDATWTPYVQHFLFWNLEYQTPSFQQVPGDDNIQFIPPLAGGVAQIVINSITSQLNDATQRAFNQIVARSMAGTHWTATGGGHSSVFPEPETASAAGRRGLAHATNLRERSLAADLARRATRLNPAFPYEARGASTTLFSS